MEFNCITWSDVTSEFEVQAELYCHLKRMGFLVRGCVKSRCKDGSKFPRVFFDLVVFDHMHNAVAIIEVKNHQKSRKRELGGRQGRRYSMFNVPVITCWNMGDISDATERLKSIL